MRTDVHRGSIPTSQVSQVERLARVILARVDTTGDDNLKFFDND